jgi:hypothetical protein
MTRYGIVAHSTGFRITGGRRRYNAQRQVLAEYRRYRIAQLLRQHNLDPFARGTKRKLAKLLDVHEGTIGRDMKLMHQRFLQVFYGRSEDSMLLHMQLTGWVPTYRVRYCPSSLRSISTRFS